LGDGRSAIVRAKFAVAQVLPQPQDEPGVHVRPMLAEIGKRADLPESFNLRGAGYRSGDCGIVGKALEHGKVDGLGCGR